MYKKYYLIISLLFLSISFSQKNNNNVINKVSFVGNKLIDSDELRDQIELKPPSIMMFSSIDFDRRLLKLDAINIKNYYNSKGFLETTVKDSFYVNDNQVDIFFLINEGRQFILKNVKIEGLNSLDDNDVLLSLGLLEGQPYNPININIRGNPKVNTEPPNKGIAIITAGTSPIKVLIIAVKVRAAIISLILIGAMNKFVKFLLHISSRNIILKLILALNRKSYKIAAVSITPIVLL